MRELDCSVILRDGQQTRVGERQPAQLEIQTSRPRAEGAHQGGCEMVSNSYHSQL